MKKLLLIIPSLLSSVVAALPVLTCPACWPLYAGLLSSMGLSFVNYTQYIMPATVVMLAISLFSMWWKASSRRGLPPLFFGIIAAVLLIGASIWNIWPRKQCSVCT